MSKAEHKTEGRRPCRPVIVSDFGVRPLGFFGPSGFEHWISIHGAHKEGYFCPPGASGSGTVNLTVVPAPRWDSISHRPLRVRSRS